jgi:hypothetical protein
MGMKNLLLSVFRPLALVSLLTAALPGCRTDAEAVCDYKCECEGCSDATVDICYHDSEGHELEADRDGCIDLYDELQACEYDTGYCKGGSDWETSCGAEKDRYNNCRK